MRRTTVVLAILSCAIIVACVVVLYGVCTYSFSALMPPAAVTQTSGESTTTPVTPDSSEDGNGKRQQGIPVAMIIGMGLGSTVTFYLLHLRHVDSNISDMQRPMQR